MVVRALLHGVFLEPSRRSSVQPEPVVTSVLVQWCIWNVHPHIYAIIIERRNTFDYTVYNYTLYKSIVLYFYVNVTHYKVPGYIIYSQDYYIYWTITDSLFSCTNYMIYTVSVVPTRSCSRNWCCIFIRMLYESRRLQRRSGWNLSFVKAEEHSSVVEHSSVGQCRMAEVCRKGTLGSMLAWRAASLHLIRLLFVLKPPLWEKEGKLQSEPMGGWLKELQLSWPHPY